jgi:hypothetical protein
MTRRDEGETPYGLPFALLRHVRTSTPQESERGTFTVRCCVIAHIA